MLGWRRNFISLYHTHENADLLSPHFVLPRLSFIIPLKATQCEFLHLLHDYHWQTVAMLLHLIWFGIVTSSFSTQI